VGIRPDKQQLFFCHQLLAFSAAAESNRWIHGSIAFIVVIIPAVPGLACEEGAANGEAC